MFAVIYQFEVIEGKSKVFEKAWKQLTDLIIKFEGGLGSRLHKKSDQIYIAYAQWPDRETWQKSGGSLPEESIKLREEMRDACKKIDTLYELEMVDDRLIKHF